MIRCTQNNLGILREKQARSVSPRVFTRFSCHQLMRHHLACCGPAKNTKGLPTRTRRRIRIYQCVPTARQNHVSHSTRLRPPKATNNPDKPKCQISLSCLSLFTKKELRSVRKSSFAYISWKIRITFLSANQKRNKNSADIDRHAGKWYRQHSNSRTRIDSWCCMARVFPRFLRAVKWDSNAAWSCYGLMETRTTFFYLQNKVSDERYW